MHLLTFHERFVEKTVRHRQVPWHCGLHHTEVKTLPSLYDIFAVGNGLMWPSFMSILSRRAGSKLQGAVQGVAGSFGGLASIVGLTLGGFLYNSIGGFTFLVSAGVILVIFVMSFRLLKEKEA